MRLEVNMVLPSAKIACKYYEGLLGASIVMATDFEQGMNESIIKIGETEIRLLDENQAFGMYAPKEISSSTSLNIWVEDIERFYKHIENEGCQIISRLKEFPERPAKNAVFIDKYNYIWIINQIY